MKLAFIGGTRFIGHTAVELALSRGHRVSVLHRGQHPLEVAGAEEVLVDRRDPSALSAALARLRPDALVDTRAMTRADGETLALALRILRVPAVVLSSQDVYAQFGRLNGLPAPEPEAIVTETSPLTIPFPFRSLGVHDAGPDYDKKDVEAVLAAEDLPPVCALRLPAVYGSRDPRRRFGAFVDRIDAGERVFPCAGGAAWRHTHAHVRDVAQAILLAAERTPAGFSVFNVAEAEVPTMRERVEVIARHMDSDIAWRETDLELPADLEALGRMPNDMVTSSAKIREALGFREITSERERCADVIAAARSSRSVTKP